MEKSGMAIRVLLSILLTLACLSLISCGRTPSRILGKDQRQILKVKHLQKFISISFDWQKTSTVKDITYLADDGYIYTQEFMDISPLEGIIRWVPANESDSLVQTRAISRWTGGVVNLRLPEDCLQVLGVDITFSSKSERTKMLTYLSTKGEILSREYKEGLLSRHFAGWLEIKRAE